MPDYEKFAREVELPKEEPQTTTHEARRFLPVTHEKYQGLATEKGYVQFENRIKKVRYTHEAMIDILLSEPSIKHAELAERFGRTRYWVNVVINSDAFQAALAKRRDDLMDPFLLATVEERLRGLAHQSLEIIAEKLESTRSLDTAMKGLEIATKALGFGARLPQNVQNNFVVQLPEKSPTTSDWLKKRETINA